MSLPLPGKPKDLPFVKNKENLTITELQAFMQKYGLSHQEFADTLGVTIQAITLWIKGQREISLTVTRTVRLLNKYPQLIREFAP